MTYFVDTFVERIVAAALTAVALAAPASAQAPSWVSGVAKVRVRQALGRPPATAFVVGVGQDTVWLVTSAHVVAGDQAPKIEFAAAPNRSYDATIRAFEGDDERGLALLAVAGAPSGISVLARSAEPVALGNPVTVGGYPASGPSLASVDTAIAIVSGRDLLLREETEEGFSGGPVLKNDAVVGIVYGREGRRGKALGASSIAPFLEGNGIVWATAPVKSNEGIAPSSPRLQGTGNLQADFKNLAALTKAGRLRELRRESRDSITGSPAWIVAPSILSGATECYTYLADNDTNRVVCAFPRAKVTVSDLVAELKLTIPGLVFGENQRNDDDWLDRLDGDASGVSVTVSRHKLTPNVVDVAFNESR